MIRLAVVLLMLVTYASTAADDAPSIRMIRAYGGTNERLPPIVMLNASGDASLGSPFATIEFDVASVSIPNVYARLIHCRADWTPDENGFLTDVTLRTSLVDWALAPERSRYHRYRGSMQIPNAQTTLRFSGNWLVTVHDAQTDAKLAETRIFVVDQRASMALSFMTDFYEPRKRVSSIAYTIEALLRDPTNALLSNNLHTVTFYRNHRWSEPMLVSQQADATLMLRTDGQNAVVGMLQAGKVFRLARIPAQNEYRVLDLTDLSRYPSTGEPVRMPLSDLRRNGMFLERADDGAMITRGIATRNDEYIPVEILLDPAPGGPSDDDVFVVGSFNQWKPDRSWMMYYDDDLRLYRCRNWIRRGRHNYLYATGRLDADTEQVTDVSYEEFEGNTASASNSFVAFAYYRELDYGGYDGIVAVGASNMYSGGR